MTTMKNELITLFMTLATLVTGQSLEPCNLLLENDHWKEAKECYLNAIVKGGDESNAWYNIARMYFHEENYGTASQASDFAIQADSTNSKGWTMKGWCLFETDEKRQAITHFSRALMIDTTSTSASYGMVQALDDVFGGTEIDLQLYYADMAIQNEVRKRAYLYRRRAILRLVVGLNNRACEDLAIARDLGDQYSNTLIFTYCDK